MRPLRYSINITLDGCCDHWAVIPHEALHRHAAETLAQADALVRRLKQEAGRGTLVGGVRLPLALKLVSRLELGSGAVALRYVPSR
ncbi:MAG: hypothetical protein ACYC7F_02170 [Gemmatimonadaceae bacterium]